MKYEELIKKVLDGRSVNATAKAIGIPQKTMDQYVKANHLPPCDVAIVLAKAANCSIEEAVIAIANKKAELQPERVHSFLRPAMAAVLGGVMSVSLILTPTPSQAAPAKALSAGAIYIM